MWRLSSPNSWARQGSQTGKDASVLRQNFLLTGIFFSLSLEPSADYRISSCGVDDISLRSADSTSAEHLHSTLMLAESDISGLLVVLMRESQCAAQGGLEVLHSRDSP